jgi:hypothetical protein
MAPARPGHEGDKETAAADPLAPSLVGAHALVKAERAEVRG